MWLDQMAPVKLVGPVYYNARCIIKVIQVVNSSAKVKALTDNGSVFGIGDNYDTATTINLLPAERWEGDFLKIYVESGMVIVHELPYGNLPISRDI